MEAKLLKGGKHITVRTAEQETALRMKAQAIREEQEKEAFVALI